MVEPNAHFYKPDHFEQRLVEVQRRIEELSLRARQTPSGGQNMDYVPVGGTPDTTGDQPQYQQQQYMPMGQAA